jgi:hypothetical protein
VRTNEQTDGQRNERTNEKDNFLQLFHGKNKSHFDNNDDDHVRLVVRKHAGQCDSSEVSCRSYGTFTLSCIFNMNESCERIVTGHSVPLTQ